MSDQLPAIAVLIPTYNRGDLLRENLKYLKENLKYQGSISLIIGDDSDDNSQAAKPFSGFIDFPFQYVRHNPRRGLGANLNWLCQQAIAGGHELAIAMDDDHRLIKPLDITPYVQRLVADPTAGWVRLMGTGGHKLEAALDETFWRASWFCPELYIASFRAHLFKVREWLEIYGPFPEGLKLGQTEEHYNHICIDTARIRLMRNEPTLDVLVPLQAPEDCWTETGHSWQLEGF
jgi:glycosyltransferase involved in cell wall biosynthesis